MNPFRYVLTHLGLNNQNQLHQGFVYLLLASLADREDSDPQANTYANPWREVIHRLAPYEGFALVRLRQILNTHSDKYERA